MLYSVYVYSVYACTRCMLYGVFAVLGVCFTRCQLMIMTWWDREGWLDFVFCDDGRVMDEKERDGGWQEWCGVYQQIWEIRDMPCLIGLGRPCIGESRRRIGTPTFPIGDGTLTRTGYSRSPSDSCWFAQSLLVSLLLVLNSTVT